MWNKIKQYTSREANMTNKSHILISSFHFQVNMIARLPEARKMAYEIRSALPETRIIMGGSAAVRAKNKLKDC